MRFNAILLVAFTVFNYQNSYATSCSEVDIRDIKPELKEMFSTPREQHNSNWCYAFTAADLISAEAGKQVSAAHAGAIYNKSMAINPILNLQARFSRAFSKNQYKDIYEGGYTDRAIKAIVKEKTVCSENKMSFLKNFAFVEDLNDLQINLKAKSNPMTPEAGLVKLSELLRGYNYPHSDPEATLTEVRTRNLNIVVEKIFRDNCSDLISASYTVHKLDKPLESVSADSNGFLTKEYFATIDKQLEIGKPIGLAYSTRFVRKEKGGSHASVITARRWNNGTCEYKIRNSWGKTCEYYKKEIDCIEDEGSFWVSESLLSQMSDTIFYIK
jgi:hypothetical protein